MINNILYFSIEMKKREFDSLRYKVLKLINQGFAISIFAKSVIAKNKKIN